MLEAVPPRRGSYTGGANSTVVSEMFDAGFEYSRYYEVVVTAETLAGSSNTSVNFSELGKLHVKSFCCHVTVLH